MKLNVYIHSCLLYVLAIFIAVFPFSVAPALVNISYALLLTLAVIHISIQKNWQIDSLSIVVIIFMVCVAVSGVLNDTDFFSYKSSFALVRIFAIFLLLRLIPLNSYEIAHFVVIPLVVSMFILLLIGLYKFYFLSPSELFFLIDSSGAKVPRFHIFMNPNSTAIYANLCLAFILPFITYPSRLIQSFAYVGVGILLLMILYLGSKMGIGVALIVCGLYGLFIRNFTTYVKLSIIGGIICLAAYFIVLNYENIMVKLLYSEEPRGIIYHVGLKTFIEHGNYFFGIGVDQFRNIDFLPYFGERLAVVYNAHNLLLHLLIENGIFGLFFYLCLWALIIIYALKQQKENPSFLKHSFWLLFISHFLTSLTEVPLGLYTGLPLFLLIAILISKRRILNVSH
ncbi:hypothetical protein CCZ01_05910 [Helicobacter monodelphidis]|uniref:O-antigen ligase family protein n=1 Tax=Helicobacter sp. 15-1451 TaxID=2004995 RepID=UPI000DCDA399|nr:O-antigen ligase family protein [Helicobacter sp. 15-1451]RAX57515.1 hypothetical protein CCZ01_05910 [Helicobacter sp. 15-1451]